EREVGSELSTARSEPPGWATALACLAGAAVGRRTVGARGFRASVGSGASAGPAGAAAAGGGAGPPRAAPAPPRPIRIRASRRLRRLRENDVVMRLISFPSIHPAQAPPRGEEGSAVGFARRAPVAPLSQPALIRRGGGGDRARRAGRRQGGS